MTSAPIGQTVAFGHVGLQVGDLERSRAYYRDIIGLVEIEKQLRKDPYLQIETGYPGVELDIAVLMEPRSGVLLELLEYRGVDRAAVDPATSNPGTGHVCFEVDDVDAIYRRALAAGAAAVSEPVVPTSGRWTDGRCVYLLDPDGIRVELVQRAPSAATQAATVGGVGIEQVFLVEAFYSAGADEARQPYRAAHLGRMARLIGQGVVLAAGAYLDRLSSSVMLIRATSADEARRLVEDDVYVAAGVWETIGVRPFGRVLPPTDANTPPPGRAGGA